MPVHATNPAAAVYWNPANTASGNYTLKGSKADGAYFTGKTCGLADDVMVEQDVNAGLLSPVSAPVGEALGAVTSEGFSPNGIPPDVAADPVYRDHHAPATYGLQSYIAYPITLTNGEIFGALCAIDAKPAKLDTPQVRGMFDLFAQLIATDRRRYAQIIRERKITGD